MNTQTAPRTNSFSIASIVAIVSAILSFATGAIFGLFFAVIAIIAGLAGILMAASPSRRGGMVSTLAIVGGLVGIVAAVVKAIMFFF